MAERRSYKVYIKRDKEELLNLKESDIDKELIVNYFGDFDDETGPRFRPYDTLVVPKNSYGPPNKRNKNEFTTTVGLWIFNKYFIEKNLFNIFGYINETINGKKLKEINKVLSHAILEEEITINELKPYLMKQQHMMRFVSILSPNHTMKMLKTSEVIRKDKERLIKEHKEALKDGDEVVAGQIEQELLKIAKEYLKDDPSMDIYESQARGSFDNNFKNMFIMRGPIMNPTTNKFEIATSNYMDGIDKDEYTIFANSLVGAGYAKSNNTALGGYWAKLYVSAFQHIILDPPGSDCGTNRHITVTLTKDNIDGYMYSFIKEGGKLVELNSKNRDKYLNKTVNIRFSSLCESKTGICNACIGTLFYKIGIQNVGMTTIAVPNRIMQLSMKKFHNQQVHLQDMDVMKAFGV